MLATLDFAFCIGSTPTFFCFDLYLNIACAAHYVYELTTDMLFDQYIFKIYFLVMENGDSDVQNEYPIVSTVSRVDILSSPSDGTSESKYQKRWQHWQQHQYLSTELLQPTNKVLYSETSRIRHF